MKCFDGGTLWRTASAMAEIFSCGTDNIYLHVKNIITDGWLIEDPLINDGFDKLYNLDMMIAVSYRVNSAKALQFRIWANMGDKKTEGILFN